MTNTQKQKIHKTVFGIILFGLDSADGKLTILMFKLSKLCTTATTSRSIHSLAKTLFNTPNMEKLHVLTDSKFILPYRINMINTNKGPLKD